MKRHLRLMRWLLVTLVLVSAGAPRPAIAQIPGREIVGYVVDSSNPGYIVLGGGNTVAIDNHTRYWIQPLSAKPRKGTFGDLRVDHLVRVVLGADEVAKSVTVLEGQ